MRLLTALLCFCLTGPALAVEQLAVEVVDRKPQDRGHWVQGLEIHDGQLYLSAGQYGQSKLVRYDFDSGELDVRRDLHPRLFAEGLTVLDDKVYQLTWKAGVVLVVMMMVMMMMMMMMMMMVVLVMVVVIKRISTTLWSTNQHNLKNLNM